MYTQVIIFLCGILIGGVAVFAVMAIFYRGKKLSHILLEDELRSLNQKIGELPLNMLDKVSSQLTKQSEQVLLRERSLTALELNKVNQTINAMSALVRELELDRELKYGQISNALNVTLESHRELANLTQQLHSVIYQKQTRGQWGERMAVDILRLAGFQEGVNYYAQKSLESSGNRPDFTFILPKGYVLNMDVKFPLENYSRSVNSENEHETNKFLTLFVNDVKKHIKVVSAKEYISPQENTLDFVVMFIPSDLIYTVIFQEDPHIMDEALRQRVVVCSPSTLYAVLAVIRQAADNYALERSTNEILKLMETFIREWGAYSEKFESLGKRIEAVSKEYMDLSGTRTRMLNKPVQAFGELIKNSSGEQDEG